jgi:predicted secreted protein
VIFVTSADPVATMNQDIRECSSQRGITGFQYRMASMVGMFIRTCMKDFIGFSSPALLLLWLLCGAACLHASETVVVNKSFNKREIKVRVGGSIRVELEELGAAGYTWKLQNLDEDHFESPEVQTDGPPPQGDFTGAPVLKIWLIRVKKAGLSELKFIHYRPWEGEETTADTFYLRVRIVP